MKNSYRSHNPKIIALIIEIVLLVVGFTLALIFDGIGKPINIVVVTVVSAVLLFSLILTLSLIKYDSFRAIRKEFKSSNLPLYTDKTSMICHDLIDEKHKEED